MHFEIDEMRKNEKEKRLYNKLTNHQKMNLYLSLISVLSPFSTLLPST